jgi:PQQ-dependent dehydrogenase (s-GDH family)
MGVFLAVLLLVGGGAVPGTAGFVMRVVARGLGNPDEIVAGPDGRIWATEKSGRRVLRIDPVSGAVAVAGTIGEAVSTPGAQDGLLGMALRLPDVFLAYSYRAADGERFKIARYAYDEATGLLGAHTDLVTGLPASPDHDSGRLVLGPDDRLYYTIGDQGNNQLGRACLTNHAQDRTVLEGKVLRIGLDGTVAVFSSGHRNPQGLVFGRDKLYSSEQGPKSDDEVNWIRAGRDYGWPRVAGYADDNAYGYANWSASPDCKAFSDYDIPPSVPVLAESAFHDPRFAPPLRTFSTVPAGYDFRNPSCGNMCWPTVAPSSLDYYGGDAIPRWRHSLLMPTLKDGTVYRMALSADGTSVVGPSVPEFRTVNRYRDTAISADGRSVYVATDLAGTTRGLDGRPTSVLADPGAILEFRYASSRASVRSSGPS